jgi:nucleoside-diphosphate-sugar epimerase
MRCFVTGATGHLGHFVVGGLVERRHEVAVLARPASDLGQFASGVTLVRGELGRADAFAAQLEAFRPEVTLHLAWSGVNGPGRFDEAEQTGVNLRGSLELLRAACRAGTRCFVGLGSQAEYGDCDTVLDERTPARPQTAYGRAKLEAARLSQDLCARAGGRYLWLRLLATYGPRDDERRLIPRVIGQLLDGRQPALTSGRQLYDYLYVEDAARAVIAAATRAEAEGVFVLSSGAAHSVRSIAERIRDLIDPALPLGFGEVADGAEGRGLRGDASRLRKVTGWAPLVELEEGLRRTIEWQRERRQSMRHAERGVT